MKQQHILYHKFLLFFTFLLFSMASFNMHAQEIMYLKPEFFKPLEGKVVKNNGEKIDYTVPFGTHKGTGKPWVVYSDRHNNKIYKKANITSDIEKTNIKFMEKFFVVEEQDVFVKIAKVNFKGGEFEVEKEYGWIPKANLLLWTHCIYNEQEITKKALVLNNIDLMKRNGKIDTSKIAKFYRHPDMSKKDILLTSRLFKVYYVYKVLPDAVLVGRAKNFESSDNHIAMLGWVSPEKITFWDSRVCLEHNSKPDAVDERKQHNDEYIVFDTKYAARVYRDGNEPEDNHVIMKQDDYGYKRRPGHLIRFPILGEDNMPENVLKVCSIGELVSKDGNIDPKDMDKAIKKLRKTLDDVKMINILFVVDGSKGMRPFLEKISEAIDIGTNALQDSGKDIKMGVVVYRNEDAGKKQMFDLKRLDKPAKISSFIRNDVDAEIPFVSKGSLLFEGMQMAINNADLPKKQTNIVIVIGREGNANEELQKTIVRQVAETNCHVMAIQVDNKNSDIYDDFFYQFKDIILSAATKRYEKYNQEDGRVWSPRFDEASSGKSQYLKYKLKNTSAIGTLIYPSAGRQLTPDELQNEIIDVIRNIEHNVSQYAKRLNNMIQGTGSGDTQYDKFDPSIFLLLDDLTKNEKNAVSEENFQGSKVGYAVLKKNNKTKHLLYEYALFLGNDELSEINRILSDFSNTSLTRDELLRSIEDTWRTTLRNYEGVKNKDYDDLTLEQIHKKIFGLPMQNTFLQGIKLKEVKDMSEKTTNTYISLLDDVYSALNAILVNGSNYPYSFENDRDIYYWILERDLP